MKKDPFKEYLKESEPDKRSKGYAWNTAIGLQAVDGLEPSEYLIDTAIKNIEGEITLKEAQDLIDSYYEEKAAHLSDDERTEEADKVSLRITKILSETAFSFSPNEYISIHRKLFEGNTRTTAVFFIKYLRTLGFSAANDIFAEHAWYFRNALVRANYTDLQQGIYGTTEYLEAFLRNLLLDEKKAAQSESAHKEVIV